MFGEIGWFDESFTEGGREDCTIVCCFFLCLGFRLWWIRLRNYRMRRRSRLIRGGRFSRLWCRISRLWRNWVEIRKRWKIKNKIWYRKLKGWKKLSKKRTKNSNKNEKILINNSDNSKQDRKQFKPSLEKNNKQSKDFKMVWENTSKKIHSKIR